jgi:hypothetical protein
MDAYRKGVAAPAIEFPAPAFRIWATGGSFPLLPTVEAGEIFLAMRRHPRLDDTSRTWRARAVQGDFNATTDRDQFQSEPRSTAGLWPVLSGAAFNLWNPDAGEAFAWADPELITRVLQKKRLNQQRRMGSPFSEFSPRWAADPATLPCRNPRIAFRDVTNRTNRRTVICALVPGQSVLTNKAPFFLWPRGTERDQAYLLGILSSIPLDWYARCVVELSLNFHVLNGLPIPEPAPESDLRHRVETIAGTLAAADHRFAAWAGAVGVEAGLVPEDEKTDLIAELDAVVARLYGLTEGQIEHIFATFHRGWDHSDRLGRVLTHFDRWASGA